jgi:hypothetical protein
MNISIDYFKTFVPFEKMYNFTLGQNDNFSQKNQPGKNHVPFMPHALIKTNILLVNVDILVKLNLLKNHDLL